MSDDNSRRSTNGIKEYHEVVVEALIEAKKKEDAAERTMINSGLCVLAILLAGVVYIVIKLTTGDHPSSYLSFLMSDMIILLWIASVFISFYFFDGKTKKYEKAEKDFDELKEDIMDRSTEIWNSDTLEIKKIAQYHELKDKHDINLYHK